MPVTRHIAIDLGAETGRVMLGTLDGDSPDSARLTLDEMHRFANRPVTFFGTSRWDLATLWHEIKAGLTKVARLARDKAFDVSTVSADSWGVDYVLSRGTPDAPGGAMLTPPFMYRDGRTARPFADLSGEADQSAIFAETGVGSLSINTLYQWVADARADFPVVTLAERILLIGDAVNFLLSGVPSAEVSLASTTQAFNPVTRTWSMPLVRRFGLPGHALPTLVESGTVLGPIHPSVAAETGLEVSVNVVAGCSHDTGCAVAAVPAAGDDWAFLSSGTWSLLGIELPKPMITEHVRRAGFTNEQGYRGTTRLLKNLSGLFVLQECRRTWAAAGEDLSYADLARAAETAEPLRSIVRPDAASFGRPGDMPSRLDDYCRQTGQPVPDSPGAYTRCIYESLALLYRQTLQQAENVTNWRVNRLHVVGGGSQAALLNRLTADATGREVIAGPVEATAAGNVLIGAAAVGVLPPQRVRDVVRRSLNVQTVVPRDTEAMNAAAERFVSLPTV